MNIRWTKRQIDAGITAFELERMAPARPLDVLDLKHCPFCGGAAEFRRAYQHWPSGGTWGVKCSECKTMGPMRGQGEEGQRRAAETWNRRAEA